MSSGRRKQQAQGLQGLHRSSACVIAISVVLYGTPDCENTKYRPVTPVPALGTLFLLICCHVQLQEKSFCLNLLYFILSCLVMISLKPVCSVASPSLKRGLRWCHLLWSFPTWLASFVVSTALLFSEILLPAETPLRQSILHCAGDRHQEWIGGGWAFPLLSTVS